VQEMKYLLPRSATVDAILIPKPRRKINASTIFLNKKRLIRYRSVPRVYIVDGVQLSELEGLERDFNIVITRAELMSSYPIPEEVGVFSVLLPYTPRRLLESLHANKLYVNTKVRVRGVDLHVWFLIRFRVKERRRILVLGDKESVWNLTNIITRYHRGEKVMDWLEAYGAFYLIPFIELKTNHSHYKVVWYS